MGLALVLAPSVLISVPSKRWETAVELEWARDKARVRDAETATQIHDKPIDTSEIGHEQQDRRREEW